MAFLPPLIAAAAPYLAGASAVGTAVEYGQKSQADIYNAQVMANQQRTSVNQATQQEGIVRRESAEHLGRQVAAFGGAGVGYGGSSRVALDQSAVNQELDALNTRYRGRVVGYGYGVESELLRRQASADETAGVLLAGGQALKRINYAPGATSSESLGGDGGGLGPRGV